MAKDNSKKLASYFLELGYDSLALRWFEVHLKSIKKIIKKEPNINALNQLKAEELAVLVDYSNLILRLAPKKPVRALNAGGPHSHRFNKNQTMPPKSAANQS